MSDTSQGPGWWLASDGKWYPPETWTGPPLPTAMPAGSPLPQPNGYPSASGYPAYQTAPFVVASQNNGLAVASLVCSCAGIIPFFFGVPCILGIVFGFVARSQIERSNGVQRGKGLALAGIIVGFSLIALFVLIIILVAALGHSCNINSSNCTVN